MDLLTHVTFYGTAERLVWSEEHTLGDAESDTLLMEAPSVREISQLNT